MPFQSGTPRRPSASCMMQRQSVALSVAGTCSICLMRLIVCQWSIVHCAPAIMQGEGGAARTVHNV